MRETEKDVFRFDLFRIHLMPHERNMLCEASLVRFCRACNAWHPAGRSVQEAVETGMVVLDMLAAIHDDATTAMLNG